MPEIIMALPGLLAVGLDFEKIHPFFPCRYWK